MTNWPAGVDLIELDRVDSTNAEAGRRLNSVKRPTWILAREQTTGKGRHGRPWQAPRGNLNTSMVYPLPGPLNVVALRSFVASLALRDSFVALAGDRAAFSLKWPNDVLLNEGKVAGILLETFGTGPSHLCIGIGVNLLAAPTDDGSAFPPVCLKVQTGVVVTAKEFLARLAENFSHWEKVLATQGFEPVRRNWLDHAARLGQNITARTPNEDVTGVFETVDLDGAVRLNTPQGDRRIAAADIFFS